MVETLDEILRKALQCHGSDVFVVPGSPIMTKVNGKIFPISEVSFCFEALSKDSAWNGSGL